MQDFKEDKVKESVTAKWGSAENCDQSVEITPAPDKSHAIVFSHGWEMTMMNWAYHCTLLNQALAPVEAFELPSCPKTSCAWSQDSAVFAVLTSADGYCLLLGDVKRQAFTLIPVSYPQFLFNFEASSRLLIKCDPEQCRAINSEAVLEGDKAAYPVRRFKSIPDTPIALSGLEWLPVAQITRIASIKQSPVLDTGFTPDGFFPFTGKFPASTTEVLNGRQMEVFHLELFAEYGDRQAQQWLAAIKEKKGGNPQGWGAIRYSRVSKHLGNLQRSVPAGVG